MPGIAKEIETDMGDSRTSDAEVAVLRSNYDLMVVRFNHEVDVLRHELDMARQDARERFESFSATHVRNHEKEHEAEQHAAALATDNMNRRLEGMNEFRRQITDAETKYSTKVEMTAHIDSNETQLTVIKDRLGACERTAIQDRGNTLDRKSADDRFRALERLVYMATGAVTVIMIILNFIKRG